MYFVFGVESTIDEKNTKLVPITKELFHPNIQILSQKIIKHLYPNATDNFIKEALEEQLISPLKVYPTQYVNNGSFNTQIDPLIEYLTFTGQAKAGKNILKNDLFVQHINSEIESVMTTGWKNIMKKSYQFSNNINNRVIKLNSDQSQKILVMMVSLKHAMDKNMYVTIQSDTDDTIYDILMQNTIYFDKTDISKMQLLYKIKFGFIDLENDQFESIVNFTPCKLDINLKNKSQSRMLQYTYDEFITNILNAGFDVESAKFDKNILVNRKTIKLK